VLLRDLHLPVLLELNAGAHVCAHLWVALVQVPNTEERQLRRVKFGTVEEVVAAVRGTRYLHSAARR